MPDIRHISAIKIGNGFLQGQFASFGTATVGWGGGRAELGGWGNWWGTGESPASIVSRTS
jgi:hypothetical protein